MNHRLQGHGRSLRAAAALLLCLTLLLGGTRRLPAATIDASLLNGDTKKYEALLNTIQSVKQQDDETTLQVTLLYKLINLAKVKPPPAIEVTPPRNEKEYRKLFADYIRWSVKNRTLKKNITEAENKLELLQEQIISLAENHKKALTRKLQYAFYHRGSQIYRQQLQVLDKAMALVPTVLADAIPKLTFDVKTSKANLEKLAVACKKTITRIQEKKLEEQRLKLLGRFDQAQKLENAVARLRQQRQDLLHKKLQEYFIQFSYALQLGDKRVFTLQKESYALLDELDDGAYLKSDLKKLAARMEKEILGTASTLKGATLQRLKTLVLLFWQRVNAPILTFKHTSISTLKIFLALLVFVLGFFLGQIYRNNIKNLAPKSKTLTQSTRTLLANLGYYLIILLGFFIALNILGINITSLALVAGALSVGIGFGLQNIVSNFVSGTILLFERSIKIGDYLELDKELTGHVTDIRMRSIIVKTNTNIDVVVPNQDLIQNRVINWTMNDRIRRFDIPFSVAYGTSPEKVIALVTTAVLEGGFPFLVNTAARHPRVVMTAMGDSSLDFELFVWVKGPEIFYPKRTVSKLLILVYNTLEEHGIEIPFPQLDLHLRSPAVDMPSPGRQAPPND